MTHPPGGESANAALVNPANEQLVGTRFTPEECWRYLHGDPLTGRWDKDFATYPSQSIDGLVTEFGGDALRLALEALPADSEGRRCAVGRAVTTPASFELRELFQSIVHAVPPFYRGSKFPAWAEQLRATYHAAFDTAAREGLTTLAVPLLGAGARGAPVDEAMAVAAEAAVSWQLAGVAAAAAQDDQGAPHTSLIARFGVQDSSTAHALIASLETAMVRSTDNGRPLFDPAPPRAKDERWSL